MYSILALPLISLLSLASAQSTCDANSAMTPEQLVAALSETPDASSYSSSGSGNSCDLFPSCPYCDQDPTFELCQSWHQTQLSDMLNANMLNGAESFGNLKRDQLSSSLWSRASTFTLECTDTEVCMVTGADFYWCVDGNTFDFKDSNGGSGNLESDMYTMANGEVTKVASTATALPTPTGSGTGSVASVAAQATATGAASGSSNSNSSAGTKIERSAILRSMALLMMGAAGVWM